MPVRIRLQRHGKKGKPFYWLVAADSRSKRDGRYLEKIGTYNPNVNPAFIDVNMDSALKWLENGAVPSETARNILSHLGIMLKHHLNGGIKKGALTQEQADEKFKKWMTEKEEKIKAKLDGLIKDESEAKKKKIEAEKAVNEKRISDAANALAESEASEVEEAKSEEAPGETATAEEAKPEEAPAEDAKPEEAPAEDTKPEEAPAEEAKPEEAPAETTTAEEAKPEEAPAEDAKPEETPAEEAKPEEATAETAPAEEAKPEETSSDEAKSEEATAEETAEGKNATDEEDVSKK
mgnify:CR=1 FL=1